MNGPTPTAPTAPAVDLCTLLDGIEARLVRLADLITKQGQDTTDTDTGHQADHQGGGEGCRPTASMT